MRILKIIIVVVVGLNSAVVVLASDLPECDPTASSKTYNNCVGMKWQGRNLYMGEWKNGVPHGDGRMRTSSGHSYSGQYHEGVFQGEGTYVFPSGNVYIGSFNGGKFEGYGKMIFSGGSYYMGNWKSGHMSGLGMHVMGESPEFSDVYLGNYNNDKKNGLGLYVEPSGKADVCYYENEDYSNCYGSNILDVGSELVMAFYSLSDNDRLKIQKNLKSLGLYEAEISGDFNVQLFVGLVGFAILFLNVFEFEYQDEVDHLISSVVDF